MKKFTLFLSITIAAMVLTSSCKKEVESITLDKPTLIMQINEQQLLTATIMPEKAYDKTVVWRSSNIGVVSVDNTGLLTALSGGDAVITAMAGNYTATCNITVGVGINGVIWATRNVDAFRTFALNPESAGMFYQWNRQTAWNTTGNVDGWNNFTPEGTTWAANNDPCPNGWRVPTKTELEGLGIGEWTTNGRQFGTAPNQIFLPAVSYRDSDGFLGYAGYGRYWSSTNIDGYNANRLGFTAIHDAKLESDFKTYGLSVRCVAAK